MFHSEKKVLRKSWAWEHTVFNCKGYISDKGALKSVIIFFNFYFQTFFLPRAVAIGHSINFFRIQDI